MKYIKPASSVIAFILAFILLTGAYASEVPDNLTPVTSRYLKDETIYINLKSDGSVSSVTAVNRIEVNESGIYEDFGSYTEITNLTDSVPLMIDNGRISWSHKNDAKSFYYQGTLKDHHLPYKFDITYSLDGVFMQGEDIAGKSGLVEISVSTYPDALADEYFLENYMLQMQANIDLETSYDVSVSDVVSVLTGKTIVLSHTVLPGRSSSFDISFWTDSFSFNGFVISCIPLSPSLLAGFDAQSISEGFDQLENAGSMITAGSQELKSGLDYINEAASDLSLGLLDLKTSTDNYKTGLGSYFTSVETLSKKACEITNALKSMENGAYDLYDTFLMIRGITDPIFEKLLDNTEESDIESVMTAKNAMLNYEIGLDSFAKSLSQLVIGMDSFSAGLKKLDNASPELLQSLGMIISGMGAISEGLSTTANELGRLPTGLDTIIDSQKQLNEGIKSAKDSLTQMLPKTS